MEKEKSIPGLEELTPHLAWLKPYVRQCGNSPRSPWKMGRRKLLDYLLVYIERGEGWFSIGRNGYEARQGDLFWIPPAVDHTMEGTSSVMVCPYIHFDLIYRYPDSHWDFIIPAGSTQPDEYGPLLHPPLPPSPLSDLAGRYRLYNQKTIGRLIQTVCLESAMARSAYTVTLSGLMLQICGEILRGIRSNSGPDEKHLASMEGAVHYIKEHLQDPMILADLAGMADMSEAWFRKNFKDYTGLSPLQFIRQQRILKAKEFLAYSNLTLGDISRLCGFAGSQSLSKTFRQIEGISPGEYKKFGHSLIASDSRIKSYPG